MSPSALPLPTMPRYLPLLAFSPRFPTWESENSLHTSSYLGLSQRLPHDLQSNWGAPGDTSGYGTGQNYSLTTYCLHGFVSSALLGLLDLLVGCGGGNMFSCLHQQAQCQAECEEALRSTESGGW